MCGKEGWLPSALEPGMTCEVCTIGMDLAKNVFQVHGPGSWPKLVALTRKVAAKHAGLGQ
jgi:hypothetical protein